MLALEKKTLREVFVSIEYLTEIQQEEDDVAVLLRSGTFGELCMSQQFA